MTDALEFELAVDCSRPHAFEVWTAKTSLWWPRDHTRSGDPGTKVTFEPAPGGRIFERTPDGTEYEWGEVLEWEPPYRLTYLWHIWGERSEGTRVEITFAELGDGTMLKIRHTGWERLGDKGRMLKERNQDGWANLMKAYAPAANG